jgi:hypothetical protein
MQIDADGNRVLLHVLAEIEVFSSIDDLLFETKHAYVQSVQQLGIPYRPAVWFGGPLSGSRRRTALRYFPAYFSGWLVKVFCVPASWNRYNCRRNQTACSRVPGTFWPSAAVLITSSPP